MIAVCESCGAVYAFKGVMPEVLKCVCECTRFKILQEV